MVAGTCWRGCTKCVVTKVCVRLMRCIKAGRTAHHNKGWHPHGSTGKAAHTLQLWTMTWFDRSCSSGSIHPRHNIDRYPLLPFGTFLWSEKVEQCCNSSKSTNLILAAVSSSHKQGPANRGHALKILDPSTVALPPQGRAVCQCSSSSRMLLSAGQWHGDTAFQLKRIRQRRQHMEAAEDFPVSGAGIKLQQVGQQLHFSTLRTCTHTPAEFESNLSGLLAGEARGKRSSCQHSQQGAAAEPR